MINVTKQPGNLDIETPETGEQQWSNLSQCSVNLTQLNSPEFVCCQAFCQISLPGWAGLTSTAQ